MVLMTPKGLVLSVILELTSKTRAALPKPAVHIPLVMRIAVAQQIREEQNAWERSSIRFGLRKRRIRARRLRWRYMNEGPWSEQSYGRPLFLVPLWTLGSNPGYT